MAVLTVARDEGAMLPRWLAHYGREVGVENLIVFDDHTEDGSTDDLPCTVHRLPGIKKGSNFERTRMVLLSGVASGLLARYDAVVFADVDEFLVADPSRYRGLVDFVAAHPEEPAMAPLTLNVIHLAGVEGRIDPGRPVLGQRRFAKFLPIMSKPMIKRVPAPWRDASHGLLSPFEVHRDLFMIHLKFFDRDHLLATSNHRRRMVEADGRAAITTWALGGDAMVDLLDEVTAEVRPESVPVFDPATADVPVVQRFDKGVFRVWGYGQLNAMRREPVVRIPPSLEGVV